MSERKAPGDVDEDAGGGCASKEAVTLPAQRRNIRSLFPVLPMQGHQLYNAAL